MIYYMDSIDISILSNYLIKTLICFYVVISVLVLFYTSKGRSLVPAPPPPAGADPTAVLLRPYSRCIPQPNPETVVVAVIGRASPRQPPFVVGCGRTMKLR